MPIRRALCAFATPCVVLLLAAWVCSGLRADTIVLKNGNVLDGEVIAENKKVVVIRLPTGNASFPRRHVKEIVRRGAPAGPSSVGLDSKSDARQEDAPEILAVYLRDGRRVPGRATDEVGERISVQTSYGTVSFSRWLVDSTGEIDEAWAAATELTDPEDEGLIAALEKRHAAIVERQRGIEQGLRQELERSADQLRDLLVARDASELFDFSRRLARVEERYPEHVRGRVRQLAGKALRSAIQISAAAEEGLSAQRTVTLYLELHRRMYSPEFREVGRFEMRRAIDQLFLTDPTEWPRAWVVLDSVEGLDWWGDLQVSRSDAWRRTTSDPEWFEDGSLPKLYRIVRSEGDPLFLARPPETPGDVESVWVPVFESVDGVAGAEPHWFRVFWCSVEQRWKRDTVAEQVAVTVRSLGRYVGEHVRCERIDTGEVAFRLQEFNKLFDHLATNRFDPRRKELRRGAEGDFDRANAILNNLFVVNSRTLRRRVHYWPAYLQLRRLQDTLRKVRVGEPVNLDAIAVPPAVVEVEPGTPVAEVEEAVLRSLSSWDVERRLATLRSLPVRSLRGSKRVVTVVQEIAASDLSLAEIRQAAQDVVDVWQAQAKAEAEAAAE